MVDLDFSLFSGVDDVEIDAHYVLTGLQKAYLDVLERALCNLLYQDAGYSEDGEECPFDIVARLKGADVPVQAHNLVGLVRLHGARVLLCQLIHDGVPGHVLCIGGARVGCAVMLRGVLKAFDLDDRIVYFQGLDDPDGLKTDLLQYQQSVFDLYHLLDMQVRFLAAGDQASFMRTLVSSVAMLNIECYTAEDVSSVLEAVHPQFSERAGVVVHYYGAPGVADAVHVFLSQHYAQDVEVIDIDGMGAYFRLPV